jgi:hypothetical protein
MLPYLWEEVKPGAQSFQPFENLRFASNTNRAPTTPSGLSVDRVLLLADERTRIRCREKDILERLCKEPESNPAGSGITLRCRLLPFSEAAWG